MMGYLGEIDPVLGGILVALLAPLGAYLAAARKMSGKIKNTEATELWAESRSIRDWSTARVAELDKHVNDLERRLADVERRNDELAEENRALTRENFALTTENTELKTRVLHLSEALVTEKAKVTQLKWEAENAPRRRNSDPPITGSGDSND